MYWQNYLTHDDSGDKFKKGIDGPEYPAERFNDTPFVPAAFYLRKINQRITLKFDLQFNCRKKSGAIVKLVTIQWGFWGMATKN